MARRSRRNPSPRRPISRIRGLVLRLTAVAFLLAIAYGGQAAASHVRRISRHAHRVQQVFGVVVIAVAMAMLLEVDGHVTAWLSQFYPSSFGGL